MRFEDVFLYLVLRPERLVRPDVIDVCGQWMRVGADAVQVVPEGRTELQDVCGRISKLCREYDTFFVVGDDLGMAAAVACDGVHLSQEALLGQARCLVGQGALLGLSSRTLQDAQLALELQPDYLLHYGGTGSHGTFSTLRATSRVQVPMFAAGLGGVENARHVVDGGVHRLCVESTELTGDDPVGCLGEYSRLLGRSV
jgi:thiamine-phosphate pyrophosphorylase